MTAMNTKTIQKAIAYSLGAHVLALALIVLVNANGAKSRYTLETVPFIHASLIYAMNGQGEQKTPPPLHQARTVRPVNRPMEHPPALSKENDKERPETTATEGARVERTTDVGTDAAVSLHLPTLKSMETREIAAIGKASGDHPAVGRQSESGKAQTGQMILPRYLNAARPAYPLIARMRGYEGMVLLAVEVLTDGRAGDVRIKKSSGYALLDQSALNAVRAWRFEPARKADTPLTMTVDIPIRFALHEAD
ncbi:MAG: hypothetical protein C0394_04600 [Syntrophus sp. (in: bacteria)]|nr:hypothetical protein [Syntrophus sp. (in: bacteria)]